jgi:hypothetical protein
MLSQVVELIVTDQNEAGTDGTMMVNLHFSDLAPTVKRSFYAALKTRLRVHYFLQRGCHTRRVLAPERRMMMLKLLAEAKARVLYAYPDDQALSEHQSAGTRLEVLTMVRGMHCAK